MEELIDNVKDLLESVSSLFVASSTSDSPQETTLPNGPISTSDSDPAVPTSSLTPTGTVNATLGCQVFLAYNSICAIPTQTAPYTTISVIPHEFSVLTVTVTPTTTAQSVEASCLCYSSSYWVPDVYDDAASACAGYLSDSSTAGSGEIIYNFVNGWSLESSTIMYSALATSASQFTGLCSSAGNVQPGATSANFAEFSPTSTPVPKSSASSTASEVTSSARRSFKCEIWVLGAGAFAVLAFI
jgi:hypothetical protein